MFRKMAHNLVANGRSATDLFTAHPTDLVYALEEAWRIRRNQPVSWELPRPVAFPSNSTGSRPTLDDAVGKCVGMPHLIYAYMIENTRILQIFRRVIQYFREGERFGFADPLTQLWLRNTETLFFSDLPFDFIGNLQSTIRPDHEATRRNAYQRMFGLPLSHQAEDNKPYPYPQAAKYNKDFITLFEDLMSEVWVGYAHRDSAGVDLTDLTRIVDRIRLLNVMLTGRRINGTLTREEFWAVATLSWFHLAVEQNHQVIVDLRSQSASPFERLSQVSQRVGLPLHSKSDSYFILADPMSEVLRAIETPGFVGTGGAVALIDGSLSVQARTIITHWESVTGRSLKARLTERRLAPAGSGR